MAKTELDRFPILLRGGTESHIIYNAGAVALMKQRGGTGILKRVRIEGLEILKGGS